MKAQSKILLAIASFSLLAGGMAIAHSQSSYAIAEGEATSYASSSDVSSTSEITSSDTSADSTGEEFTIEGKTIDQWKQEIMAYQVMGVTVSSILTIIVYWLLHYASKGDIKKALTIVGNTRDTIAVITNDMVTLKDDYKIGNDQYAKTIAILGETKKQLDSTNDVLSKVIADNAEIKSQNEALKNMLFVIASTDPNLVRSDATKKMIEALGVSENGEKK